MSREEKLNEIVEVLAKFSDKLAQDEQAKQELAKAIHNYIYDQFGRYTRKLNKDIKRAGHTGI